MKAKPYTPREVEAARMAAKFYEKGTRETIERLVATIDELRRQLEDAEHRARRAILGGIR